MGLKVEKWNTNRSQSSSQRIHKDEMIMVYQDGKEIVKYKMAMVLSVADENYVIAILAGGGIIDVEVNYK